MHTTLRQFPSATSLVLAALLTACGGGNEPTVTVFAELSSNTVFTVWDDGTVVYLLSPGPGDSNI